MSHTAIACPVCGSHDESIWEYDISAYQMYNCKKCYCVYLITKDGNSIPAGGGLIKVEDPTETDEINLHDIFDDI